MKEAAGTDRRGGAAFASGVSPVEARVESLRLPVADDHFCATFATPLPALPAVIFVHGWNKVRLTLSTHSEGGLTDADHDLARRIDEVTSG